MAAEQHRFADRPPALRGPPRDARRPRSSTASRCPGWSSGPGRSRRTSSRPSGRTSPASTATTTSTSASATPGRWPATVRRRRSPPSNARLRRGITHMLPTEDAAWVGEELTRRFGVGSWQFALSATRREPLGAPPRSPRHRALEGRRPRPLLPRLGRRGDRDARRRRLGRARSAAPSVRRSTSPRRPASSSSTTSLVSRRRSPTATSRPC